MKRSLLLVALTSVTLAGCANPDPSESRFVRDGMDVESAALRVPQLQFVGATGSSGTGTADYKSTEFTSRTVANLLILPDAAPPLDERAYLRGLAADMAAAVRRSGLRVRDPGPVEVGGAHRFLYEGEDREGAVVISAQRLPGDTFRVVGEIFERVPGPFAF